MKPVYFPFTYVPRRMAEALAACFQHFIVYQPSGRKIPHEMQSWTEANVMEVRLPAQKDVQAIDRVVKDFKSFASLHRDSKEIQTAAILRQQRAVPFLSESTASHIVADVKKNRQSEATVKIHDPLFCAQVFLDFAQEFDRQNDELSQGLGAYDQQSGDLLKNLRSDYEMDSSGIPFAAKIEVDDPGEYMALGRLRAWIRLFMENPVDSGFFVTSSPSVFTHLIENLTAIKKIIQYARLPALTVKNDAFIAWQTRFRKQIGQLVEPGWSEDETAFPEPPATMNDRPDVRLTLYRASGRSLGDLFARILKDQRSTAIKPHQMAELKNTLIGLITYSPIHP
jgi:hypothetical protein